MKIEDQVCTLEQSTRLNGLGITKPGIFNWALMGDIEKVIWGNIDQDGGRYTHWLKLPAYTVAELGEMLPRELHSTAAKESRRVLNSANDYVGFGKNSKGWFCRETEGADLKIFPTEAQARAAMLIYLLETGIINHEQIQP